MSRSVRGYCPEPTCLRFDDATRRPQRNEPAPAGWIRHEGVLHREDCQRFPKRMRKAKVTP